MIGKPQRLSRKFKREVVRLMEEGKKPPAELARVDHDGIDLICRYGNLRAVFRNNPGDGNGRKGVNRACCGYHDLLYPHIFGGARHRTDIARVLRFAQHNTDVFGFGLQRHDPVSRNKLRNL